MSFWLAQLKSWGELSFLKTRERIGNAEHVSSESQCGFVPASDQFIHQVPMLHVVQIDSSLTEPCRKTICGGFADLHREQLRLLWREGIDERVMDSECCNLSVIIEKIVPGHQNHLPQSCSEHTIVCVIYQCQNAENICHLEDAGSHEGWHLSFSMRTDQRSPARILRRADQASLEVMIVKA
ncbi:MAG: hypothetical protein IJ083_10300 [Clostridia bacterium]|nr:hypothetical protein [Clostridia bacterium]